MVDARVPEEAKDVLIGLQNVSTRRVRCNQNRVSQAKAKAQYSIAHSGQNEQQRQESHSSAAKGDR
jgi:hypothetical protein